MRFLIVAFLLINKGCEALNTGEIDVDQYQSEFESDDIVSDKLKLTIDRIQASARRFQCPKGSTRYGGSCYFRPSFQVSSLETNKTCREVHSNRSNLILIDDSIEIFFVVHLLTRENLSSLIVELSPNSIDQEKISKIFDRNQDRWLKLKKFSAEFRRKFRKFKKEIFYPMKNFSAAFFNANKDFPNEEQFEGSEKTDPFERVDDLKKICFQIDLNIGKNKSNIFLLTTYSIADKTVCSLSEVNLNEKSDFLCEYVMDFCFANFLCGKHGRCFNDLSGFKCVCYFLYGGFFCDRISESGLQIIVAAVLCFVFICFQWVLVHRFSEKILKFLFGNYRRHFRKQSLRSSTNFNSAGAKNSKATNDPDDQGETFNFINKESRRKRILQSKIDMTRTILIGIIFLLTLIVLLTVTTVGYLKKFNYDLDQNISNEIRYNQTYQIIVQCKKNSDYKKGHLLFAPFALLLVAFFCCFNSQSTSRKKTFIPLPGIIAPIEPFKTANRLSTAAVFGILAFEVLKIFEEMLFQTLRPMERGVVIELLTRISIVILIGFRYYPILASLQFRNFFVRFFALLYMIVDLCFTIVRESVCIGSSPALTSFSILEQVHHRIEIGTWFQIYGIIKICPHFALLSYVVAEMTVRCLYDSLYLQLKKHKSLIEVPIRLHDEAEFAIYYVSELFRQRGDDSDDKRKRTRFQRFIHYLYPWSDKFRFSTIATCTYTVAIIFLYYLAITFGFLYLSRMTGYMSTLKSFIEYVLRIELERDFDIKVEIIISACVVWIQFAKQLVDGMKAYKKHKTQVSQGFYEDIPQPTHICRYSLLSYSVHYSGYLVGYMAWGFVICFHLMTVICIIVRLILRQVYRIDIILQITMPILMFYLLKRSILGALSRSFLLKNAYNKPSKNDEVTSVDLTLQNQNLYGAFTYFSFFADSFIGVASCIYRYLLPIILNTVYMGRLDSSYINRSHERLDPGFSAYVGHIHIEVSQTNLIVHAFCYMIYEEILRRRGRVSYDNECCIGPQTISGSEDDNNTNSQYEQSSDTIDYSAGDTVEDENETDAQKETPNPPPKLPIRHDLKVPSNVSQSKQNKNGRNVRSRATNEFELSTVNQCETSEDERKVSDSRLIFRTVSYSEALRHQQRLFELSNRCNDEPTIKTTVNNLSYEFIGTLSIGSHSDIEQIEPMNTASPNNVQNSSNTGASKSVTVDEKQARQRRARARFRWFFLYTVLRNYHLLDLTKTIQNRILNLIINRCKLAPPIAVPIQQSNTVGIQTIDDVEDQQSSSRQSMEFSTGRLHLPPSPAEIYMNQMVISRLNCNESTCKTQFLQLLPSPFSFPREETAERRRIYGRNIAAQSIIEIEEGATESSGGYPITQDSSIIPAQALRTQTSFDQLMTQWYKDKDRLRSSEDPNRFIYGRQSQSTPICIQTVLTPEIKESIPSSNAPTSTLERQPTKSPTSISERQPTKSPTSTLERQPIKSRTSTMERQPTKSPFQRFVSPDSSNEKGK